MVIQHNMAAENGKRMHKIVSGKLIGTSEKLSSGYRVNRAADDAAGLSISEKMRFQIRGLDRGSANINEGIGYCQVADGALHEMHDMLQRMNYRYRQPMVPIRRRTEVILMMRFRC